MADDLSFQINQASSELKSPVVDPLIGSRLADRFLIEALVGSGGMSLVYRGKHESVDRIVAIKTLKLDLCSQPVIVSRFEREIKSLSRLNHPNIVTIYDCVLSAQGQPYIIMDYIEGESLETLLERGPMDAALAVKLALQICNALEHAHRHGVIHRDLKPANIMLMQKGSVLEVKVVDFGLAKLAEDTQVLTQSDELWGSLPYMSPEQCSSNVNVEIDTRSDIYSLGAVLFQMLTGKDPFHGLDIVNTIQHHLNEPPPAFREVAPTRVISAGLERVVQKALNKSREDRFQSMREFKEALEFAAVDLLKDGLSKSTRDTNFKSPAKRPTGAGRRSTVPPTFKKTKKVFPIGYAIGLSIAGTLVLAYCAMALVTGSFTLMNEHLKSATSSSPTNPSPTNPSSTSANPAAPSVSTANSSAMHPSAASPSAASSPAVRASGKPAVHATADASEKPRSSVPPERNHAKVRPEVRATEVRPSNPGLLTHANKHSVLKPMPKTKMPTVVKRTESKSPWSALESQRSQ
jgi:serine/threonine protein kinase